MTWGKRQEMIYSLVTVSNVTSIDQIASAIKVDSKKAQRIILNMIRDINALLPVFAKPYILFRNAQIDYQNKRVVLDPNSKNISTTLFKKSVGKEVPQTVAQEKVVVCKGCGAKNTVTEGTIVECSYCGTAIKG